MSEKLRDIATIPTALTLGRLAVSPYFAYKMYKNPRQWTWRTAALMGSDILDGFLARLGDKSETAAKLGFRRSEFGRKADPFTDKVVGTEMVVAGMAQGAVPKSLGYVALAQKAAISVFVAKETAQGHDIHVTQLGKHSETGINLGFGGFMLAESIDDPAIKHWARIGSGVVAVASLVGAIGANIQYWAQAQTEVVELPPPELS